MTQEPSHAVLEQAAEWYARLRDGRASGRERSDWQAWLQADEAHQLAWAYVEDVGQSFAPLQGRPDARQAADSLRRVNHRLLARRRSLAGLAALAGAGLLGGLAWREGWLPGGIMALAADYRSGTGEQREFGMEDGTRLWLNTDSAVNIHYDAQERRVELLAGEIFIATAPDARRPFLVETRQGSVRALGTRFNVYQEDGRTQVSVYQGAVEVRPARSQVVAVVAAGRQASFTDEAIAPMGEAYPARSAWTQGTLVADSIPLREFARELGRYRKGHLGVDDSVADLLVYGHFPIQDTDHALRMLAGALPVRVVQPWPWWTRIEAASARP